MSKFKDILLPIAELIERKNIDYGNSYDQLRDQFGPVAFHIRVADKLNRIIQLDSGAEQQVQNESVLDSIKDIIGYCTLELCYRESQCQIDSRNCSTCACGAYLRLKAHGSGSSIEALCKCSLS